MVALAGDVTVASVSHSLGFVMVGGLTVLEVRMSQTVVLTSVLVTPVSVYQLVKTTMLQTVELVPPGMVTLAGGVPVETVSHSLLFVMVGLTVLEVMMSQMLCVVLTSVLVTPVSVYQLVKTTM